MEGEESDVDLISELNSRFKPQNPETRKETRKPDKNEIRRGIKSIDLHGKIGFELERLLAGKQTLEQTREGLVREQLRIHERLYTTRRMVDKLKGIAYLDVLTGLPNRRSYESYMAENSGEKMGMVYIDADNFKEVNKKGYDVGDEGLKSIANAMLDQSGEEAMLFRVGGDEFVALYPNLEDNKELKMRSESMRASVEKTILETQDGDIIPFTASFYGGIFEGGTLTDADEFKNMVGLALQDNKSQGLRNTTFILGVDGSIAQPTSTQEH